MSEPEFDGIVLATVTITRVMVGDDVIDHVVAAANDVIDLGLTDALGMMRLAEHTLIQAYEAEAAE